MGKAAPPARQARRGANKPPRAPLQVEVPLFVEHRGKRQAVAGMVRLESGAWLLKKRVALSAHQLNTPGAICFSAEVLAEAYRWGCSLVRVLDRETGDLYEVAMEHFLRYSFRIERNGGGDIQRALTLAHWRRNGQASEFETVSARRVVTVLDSHQLPLFGAAATGHGEDMPDEGGAS